MTVVGSLVADHLVWLPHLPRLHETLVPTRSALHLGGKGFNQAVTARRLGASVSMVACAGEDGFGSAFQAALVGEGIDARWVDRTQVAQTGMAMPMILPSGDNTIVLIPGANEQLGLPQVEAARGRFIGCDVLLIQLEVPIMASRRAAEMTREGRGLVVLDPAPARQDAEEVIGLADWITPNEVEAAALAGCEAVDVTTAIVAGRRLLGRVRQGVVVTLGALGCVAVTAEGELHVPPFRVEPVDPTGAGDAFTAAFAVALCEGQSLEAALRFGAAAGAECVQVAGAEPGLPRRAAVEARLASATG